MSTEEEEGKVQHGTVLTTCSHTCATFAEMDYGRYEQDAGQHQRISCSHAANIMTAMPSVTGLLQAYLSIEVIEVRHSSVFTRLLPQICFLFRQRLILHRTATLDMYLKPAQ